MFLANTFIFQRKFINIIEYTVKTLADNILKSDFYKLYSFKKTIP